MCISTFREIHPHTLSKERGHTRTHFKGVQNSAGERGNCAYSNSFPGSSPVEASSLSGKDKATVEETSDYILTRVFIFREEKLN